VLRGGSFNNNQDNASCVYRNNNNPNNDNNNCGFRVVVVSGMPFPTSEDVVCKGKVCSQKWRMTTVVGLRRSGRIVPVGLVCAYITPGAYKRLGATWTRSRCALL